MTTTLLDGRRLALRYAAARRPLTATRGALRALRSSCHAPATAAAPALDAATTFDRIAACFEAGFADAEESLTCINGCCVGTHCEAKPGAAAPHAYDPAEGRSGRDGACTRCELHQEEHAPLRAPLAPNEAERWAATLPSASDLAIQAERNARTARRVGARHVVVIHGEPAPAEPSVRAPARKFVTAWEEARRNALLTALVVVLLLTAWHLAAR
jgi:hypothetical protein